MGLKTDLAIEAKQIWEKSAAENTRLRGVLARQTGHYGIPIDVVEILNAEGERALGKPRGTYVTIATEGTAVRFRREVEALARVLRDMTAGMHRVLVAGLGNRDITPDAVGPLVMPNLIVTSHLLQDGTAESGLGCISAIAPGVLGNTGMESAQMVKAAAETVGADGIIVVDALASCDPQRLCTTVQVTDTGLVPGSGIRNPRSAFSQKELGIPVIAVGVPTVMDGADLQGGRRDLIVTPRTIDMQVKDMGRLIGWSIDLAVHRGLDYDDLRLFLS